LPDPSWLAGGRIEVFAPHKSRYLLWGISEDGRPRKASLHPAAPDLDRTERIGEFWGHPESRTFGELLIDLEEDKAAQAVVVGLLKECDGC
jgi:hypothetical protein